MFQDTKLESSSTCVTLSLCSQNEVQPGLTASDFPSFPISPPALSEKSVHVLTLPTCTCHVYVCVSCVCKCLRASRLSPSFLLSSSILSSIHPSVHPFVRSSAFAITKAEMVRALHGYGLEQASENPIRAERRRLVNWDGPATFAALQSTAPSKMVRQLQEGRLHGH